jgi:hypothetical protein
MSLEQLSGLFGVGCSHSLFQGHARPVAKEREANSMMISGKTKVFGIFGYPVEHTFSPGMHNAAFAKLRMDACYVPFAVNPAQLKDAVSAVAALGLCGLNITVPHKEKVLARLDDLSEEARLIGAVNTIQIQDGKLIGHNTDGRGFIRSLRENAGFNPKGKTVLLTAREEQPGQLASASRLPGRGILFFMMSMQKRPMRWRATSGRKPARTRSPPPSIRSPRCPRLRTS